MKIVKLASLLLISQLSFVFPAFATNVSKEFKASLGLPTKPKLKDPFPRENYFTAEELDSRHRLGIGKPPVARVPRKDVTVRGPIKDVVNDQKTRSFEMVRTYQPTKKKGKTVGSIPVQSAHIQKTVGEKGLVNINKELLSNADKDGNQHLLQSTQVSRKGGFRTFQRIKYSLPDKDGNQTELKTTAIAQSADGNLRMEEVSPQGSVRLKRVDGRLHVTYKDSSGEEIMKIKEDKATGTIRRTKYVDASGKPLTTPHTEVLTDEEEISNFKNLGDIPNKKLENTGNNPQWPTLEFGFHETSFRVNSLSH